MLIPENKVEAKKLKRKKEKQKMISKKKLEKIVHRGKVKCYLLRVNGNSRSAFTINY